MLVPLSGHIQHGIWKTAKLQSTAAVTRKCYYQVKLYCACAYLLRHVRLFTTPWTVAPPGSSVHGDSPGKNTGSGLPCPPPGVLPNRGIKSRFPILKVDSLLSEPPRKPMNTGVSSLSLFRGNLPDLGIELGFPALQVDSLPAELPEKPRSFIRVMLIGTRSKWYEKEEFLSSSFVLWSPFISPIARV